MSTVREFRPISIEDYLAGEERAKRKHEYVHGMVYAMVGGRYAHNLIASNVLIELGTQLKGSNCRALNSDSKLRVELNAKTRFYYPDVSVVCGQNLRDGTYQDRPSVIVEVLSRSTRRIDEGEKLEAYLEIESLSCYLMLQQELAAATAYHRDGSTFDRRFYEGLQQTIELPQIRACLSLSSAYAEVEFTPEPEPPE